MWCQKDSSATPATTSAAPARRAQPTRSCRKNAASATAITTLVSRTAATGAASARSSASRTRTYASVARHGRRERRPAELRPQGGCAPSAPDRSEIESPRYADHELEVGERARVLDPAVVEQRVARDADGDERAEKDASALGLAKPSHEEHACPDEHDAGDLARGRGRDPNGEHEHRRQPSGDRIHDAQLRALVRVREQCEVRELERGRAERPRPHLPLHVPRHRGNGREQHDREAEHDGGRSLYVACAREQQVPPCVQERGGKRQHERRRAHSRTIVTGPSFTSSTAIRAPKTPRATWTPRPASASQKRSYSGSACSGRAARAKRRAVALLGVGDQRELRDHERLAADVEQRAIELPLVVLEDPQARDLAREPLGVRVVVTVGHAQQHAEPRPDLAAGRHPCARHPLHDRSQGAIEYGRNRTTKHRFGSGRDSGRL